MHIDQTKPGCDEERLHLYLDRELTAVEEAELESHLDQCPHCRRLLSDSAAEQPWWSAASGFLKRDDLDETGGQGADQSGIASRVLTDAAAQVVVRQVREWLDPADDPKYIGRFGGYEILGVVGYGGMGVVLKGFEPSLNRFVAVKVLSPALATSGAARQRFAREAKAAAAVLHENVMAIHRVDEWRGLPYLVMPFVGGASLQRRIDDEGPLPLSTVLRIGRQIAAGLAAAHAQGLVHRDIKPANILLDRGVDRVTITDFGLARAADDGSLTRTGVIAGTPQYMSPEQSRGDAIDARSDLFSLGGVLYAMCTGHPPFRAETGYGVLRRITDSEPRPVREINPEVPEWFEAILRRLHAKSPDERFQSAEELEELLEDCLAHVQQPTTTVLPASLRPPTSTPYSKGRRYRLAGMGVLFAMLAVAVAMLLMRARDEGPEKASKAPAGFQPKELLRDELVTIAASNDAVRTVQFSPAGDKLAAAGHDGTLRVWETKTGRQLHKILAHDGGIRCLRFSRDGKLLATGAWDRRIQVWDLNTGRSIADINNWEEDHDVAAVEFNRDATQVVSGGIDGTLRLWDVASGKQIWKSAKHPLPFTSIDVSPDGLHVVASTGDYKRRHDAGEVKVWDLEVGRELYRLDGPHGNVLTVEFSPDGRFIGATVGENAAPFRLWDVKTRKPVELSIPTSLSHRFTFLPDGRTIAIARKREFVLYDLESNREVAAFTGHPDGQIFELAASPDGSLVASASQDGTVRLWSTRRTHLLTSLLTIPAHRLNVPDPRNPRGEAVLARELKPFQGTWNFGACESEAWVAELDRVRKWRWQVQGNKITWTGPDEQEWKLSFSIDPAKSPGQIDLKFLSGPHRGATSPGIYEFKRGSLWICLSDPDANAGRPTDFSFAGDGGRTLILLDHQPEQPAAAIQELEGTWKFRVCQSEWWPVWKPSATTSLPQWRWIVTEDAMSWIGPGFDGTTASFITDVAQTPRHIISQFLTARIAAKRPAAFSS